MINHLLIGLIITISIISLAVILLLIPILKSLKSISNSSRTWIELSLSEGKNELINISNILYVDYESPSTNNLYGVTTIYCSGQIGTTRYYGEHNELIYQLIKDKLNFKESTIKIPQS